MSVSGIVPVRCSTLAEYIIPHNFNFGGKPCPEMKLTPQEISDSIENAESNRIFRQSKFGVTLSNKRINKLQLATSKVCHKMAPLTKNLIKNHKGKGKALDIGCGIGSNSFALIQHGWSVYALDIHKKTLQIFKNLLAKLKPQDASLGKCQIVNKDITKVSLTNLHLDLIMAYDVLEYLPPRSLLPTLKKIYDALLPGGIFVGTFLVNRELVDDDDVKKMGEVQIINSYSYTNPAIVPNILRNLGFQLELCSIHNPFTDATHPARIVKFVARK